MRHTRTIRSHRSLPHHGEEILSDCSLRASSLIRMALWPNFHRTNAVCPGFCHFLSKLQLAVLVHSAKKGIQSRQLMKWIENTFWKQGPHALSVWQSHDLFNVLHTTNMKKDTFLFTVDVKILHPPVKMAGYCEVGGKKNYGGTFYHPQSEITAYKNYINFFLEAGGYPNLVVQVCTPIN